MADRKVGEITVPTEPVSRATKITGFTFKSYDKNAGVLQFNIENQDGSPTDLIDATVRLFMYIYQGEEKKEFPIFDNQIITESYMQGIVKYRIPDMLLSYEGKVDANVYIDFPDGSHTDNLAFTFTIEKSIIDDNVQLNGEYYFKDFQQLLDGVKQEATDAVNAALTNIDTVSQNVTSAQNNLKAVEDKMNQTNQQIGDLGKLKKMYSNSIDFGDYDYSGNPNLLPKLTANDFRFTNTAATGYTKTDNVTYMKVTKTAGAESTGLIATVPRIKSNETYTLSVSVKALTDIVAGGLTFTLCWKDNANVTQTADAFQGQVITTTETTFSKTFTTGVVSDGVAPSLQLYFNGDLVGENEVDLHYDIKLEKGSTATPYQPNLLDAPYYLSKVALGENIANKTIKYPIKTSAYAVYTGPNTEPYIAGQTYTITMKATKPVTQIFNVFLNAGTIGFGSMTPVEGLTDVWQKTVTVRQDLIDAGVKDRLTIYQVPNSSVGAVQIDWLKIEKGDTRTPNISQFKYFGEGLKDSNNPNDYSWDVTPKYTEKGLNNTVSLTEPQSVEGLKNFEDGLQIAGKEVATIANSTGWIALTLVDGFKVAENNPPQYKITYQANGDNEIEFRGEFQLTGGTKFTKDTSYYPFGRANQATNIPNELKPDRTAFGYGATSTGVGGRLAVTTTPTFIFIPGDSDGTYCSISPLRYTQTKK
ncbi:BppU family phage baseplate upper protein [Enterococcus faecium]|uniref:BppU family phage baseplate upper protein n=1 Tax=Enterococcus faecium TaxID=1352 RepID=UPI00115A687B|nr:BppU family phage baseplate upper protein [Enterococcus faecium]